MILLCDIYSFTIFKTLFFLFFILMIAFSDGLFEPFILEMFYSWLRILFRIDLDRKERTKIKNKETINNRESKWKREREKGKWKQTLSLKL